MTSVVEWMCGKKPGAKAPKKRCRKLVVCPKCALRVLTLKGHRGSVSCMRVELDRAIRMIRGPPKTELPSAVTKVGLEQALR